MKLINIENTNIDDFIYSQPKTNAMGGQQVFINLPNTSDNDSKIRIQTPKCSVPFGINDYNGRFTLDLSLRGEDTKPFQTFINNFDSHNKKTGSINSIKWFKKQIHESVISELYKPQIRQQNEKYAPNMRVKLPMKKNGVPDFEIFDNNKNKADMSIITKGCQVQAIIELVGMYFVSKDFGITWKVVQLKVFPSTKLSGYSFQDED